MTGRAAMRGLALGQLLRRGGGDQSGIAVVEFALIVPIMLLLYVGTSAVASGVSASRATAVLARTLTDLVSQQQPNANLTDATAQDIFNASTAVMSPFPTTSLKMTLSNVEFVADSTAAASYNLRAKTRWTVTFSGGTLRPCTNPVLNSVANGTMPSPTTMPLGLYKAGFVIVADVSYVYTPSFGSFAWNFGTSGTPAPLGFSMSRTTYMRPRQTDNVRYTAGQTAQICPIAAPQTS